MVANAHYMKLLLCLDAEPRQKQPEYIQIKIYYLFNEKPGQQQPEYVQM